MKNTKRAFLASVLSLVICCAMLLGTTYAWFTDSVTSSGNIIKTGTLEVTLEYADTLPTADDQWIDASTGAIFSYTNWEPGYTEVKYVKIENEGSLDFNYVLTIVPNVKPVEGEVNLADVIEAYMFPAETVITRDLLVKTSEAYVGTVTDLINDNDGAARGVLYANDADKPADKNYVETYAIVLKMSENAGNEYQNLSLGGGFSVNLLASQLASESDDLGTDYDANATLPGVGSTSVSKTDVNPFGQLEIPVYNANNVDAAGTLKVATLLVPVDAVADTEQNVTVSVKEDVPQSEANLGIDVEGNIRTFEIKVEGLAEGNTEPVKVWLYVGSGLNIPNRPTVYHTLADGTVEEIEGVYNATTGNVVFETTSFSPFSIVIYDEPVVPSVTDVPVATIEKLEGGYQPVDGWIGDGINLDNKIKLVAPVNGLDVAYSFTAQDTVAAAADNAHANWTCDFYVKASKDLKAETIVLGGYYENVGAVAFTNLVEVEAETWVPMLQSMGQGWSYLDIVDGVGQFICGVADVDGGLAAQGVQFTVQLRLVSPTGNQEIICAEVVYDFATGQSALAH